MQEVEEKNSLLYLKKASREYQVKGIRKGLVIHLTLLIDVYNFNVITKVTLLLTIFSHSLFNLKILYVQFYIYETKS